MMILGDIVKVSVKEDDVVRVISNARKMCIGGKSNVRTGDDRERNMFQDQMVSQIAEYCASVYLTGNAIAYFMQRDIRNADPYNGDGGQDLYGIPSLDVKGHGLFAESYFAKHDLLVRPNELRKGWRYVHCLVPKSQPYRCLIPGWAMAEDLGEPYDGDIQWKRGIHVLSVARLRDIRDLRKEIKSHAHDNSTFNHRIS